MKIQKKCAFMAVAAMPVMGLSVASGQVTNITVQDSTFSSPLPMPGYPVGLNFAGTGWVSNGPSENYYIYGTYIGINTGTEAWPNPVVTSSNNLNIDNLVADSSVTPAVLTAADPAFNQSSIVWPYEGCASVQVQSVASQPYNELSQALVGASFQAGHTYSLTVGVGVAGGTYDPAIGSDCQLDLYYVDGGGTRHFIATQDVIYTGSNLSANHMLEVTATTPGLGLSDQWSGAELNQQIDVLLTTIAPSEDAGVQGGYFNVSDVVVTDEVPEPASLALLAGGACLVLPRRHRRTPSRA